MQLKRSTSKEIGVISVWLHFNNIEGQSDLGGLGDQFTYLSNLTLTKLCRGLLVRYAEDNMSPRPNACYPSSTSTIEKKNQKRTSSPSISIPRKLVFTDHYTTIVTTVWKESFRTLHSGQ